MKIGVIDFNICPKKASFSNCYCRVFSNRNKIVVDMGVFAELRGRVASGFFKGEYIHLSKRETESSQV